MQFLVPRKIGACGMFLVLAIFGGNAANAIGNYHFECLVLKARQSCPFSENATIEFQLTDLVRDTECREIVLGAAGSLEPKTNACIFPVESEQRLRRDQIPDTAGLMLASERVWQLPHDHDDDSLNTWFWSKKQSFPEPAGCELVCHQAGVKR